MLLIKILLGLAGLGIVVFVHELGHFLAARLVGINVEAFSIGWGKPVLRKRLGSVEYRLGMFPLGGYCKMKGENEFQEAWENRQNAVRAAPGSYFAASPWRRIVVSLAGPLFNLLFAALALAGIWGVGFEVETLDNRIVLLSDVDPGSVNPADKAGLRTGDRIIEIDGRKTETYHDIQESIATRPEEPLRLTVDRDGTLLDLTVVPSLEKSTGAGKIGVYFWTAPVIAEVTAGGPAAAAGLRPGDRITRINGRDVPYTVAIPRILDQDRDRDPKPATVDVEYERGGETLHTALPVTYTSAGYADLGVTWETITYRTPRLNPVSALARGAAETWKTLLVSAKSLSLLFRGIDLTRAVSGPVRITYMVGEAATAGFGQSVGMGIMSMGNFLAFISVALCVMNLLPLPVLDGGMIVLFLVEGLRRKPLHPRAIFAFQTVGVALIFGLMLFAVFGDILFLARR